MKVLKFSIFALLLACAGLILWHKPFYKECEAIRQNTLRLHIVANSDSELDQQVKLLVRDAVIAATQQLFSQSQTKQEAQIAAGSSLTLIEDTAQRTLEQNGFNYTVRAYLCETYFKQLTYGDATLPAGMYTALRVELGLAQGENWWCVMYPQLCVPSACETEQEALEEAFGEQDASIVLGGETYAVRFKLEELLQKLLAQLRGSE